MIDPREAIEERLRQHIDDDEAWRVYADLLLARGDRRGELIMLSLMQREQPELRAKLAALRADLYTDGGLNPYADGTWRHGCLIATKAELRHSWDITALENMLAHPEASLLHALELSVDDKLPRRAHAELAKLDLRHVRKLRFVDQTRGDAILRELAKTAGHRFVELDLAHAGLTHNGALALAELAEHGTLRRLHLQRNRIRAKGIALLAPKLVGLEFLDLRYNNLGPAGVQALATTPALASLRTLRIGTNELDEPSLRALAESTTLPLPIVRFFRGVLEQRVPT